MFAATLQHNAMALHDTLSAVSVLGLNDWKSWQRWKALIQTESRVRMY